MRRFFALPWRRPRRTPWLAALCLATLAGCGRNDTPAETPVGDAPVEPVSTSPERIESPALHIALAGVPGGFDVTTNQGDTLRLEREPGLPPGEVWIEVGAPVEGGVNLMEIVRGQRAEFEARPGGSFSGNGEIALPNGRPAYYSRGRFDDNSNKVEEFRVWSVHPADATRVLTVFYRYPAGEDSKKRLDDVLLLVHEIEGLA